jgi:hypothetical protein
VGALVVEDSTMAVEIRKDYLERTGQEDKKPKKRKLKQKE